MIVCLSLFFFECMVLTRAATMRSYAARVVGGVAFLNFLIFNMFVVKI